MSSRPRLTVPAALLVLVLGGAGVAHFANPGFFDPLVPDWMPGSKRLTTYVSGVVEIAAALLVAVPRTRRLGGWVALATFIAVYPANIQAALDGGMKECQLCDLPEKPGAIAVPPPSPDGRCSCGGKGACGEDVEALVASVTDAVMAALRK